MSERDRILFILRPLAKELDPVEDALKVVASETGLSGLASTGLPDGNVVTEIVKAIYEADLLVADLTDMNPNVFYELGVAHALNRSCLLIISEHGDGLGGLPFDLRDGLRVEDLSRCWRPDEATLGRRTR